jgi:hypothetical protein
MKTTIRIMLAFVAIAAFIVGCKQFGENPSAPSRFEQVIFNVHTNLVDKIVLHTNEVVVEVPEIVKTTNVQNEVVWETNKVKVTTTEVTTETNKVPAYTLTPKDSVQSGIAAGSAVANGVVPGVGGLVGGILAGVYAMWGRLRSAKVKADDATETGGVLAQNIETIREFVKTLPQGEKYDTIIKTYLQQHQMEAGVGSDVLDLLKNYVNNDTAKATVGDLKLVLQKLSTPTA